MGRGLRGGGGPRRFDQRGALSAVAEGWRPEILASSLGLLFNTTGGSLKAGYASRGFSGLGPGETALGGGAVRASEPLLMFSKRARREETGFYARVRG